MRPNLRLIAVILITAATTLLSHEHAFSENREIQPPSRTAPLAQGDLIGEIGYRCGESAKPCSITEFMDKARVCALLLLKSQKIRFYRFDSSNRFCQSDPGPNGWGKRFGIASVTKSITSTLLGHAFASKFRARTRGEFHAILSKPVDRFVKDEQPPRSAYNGVPLDRAMRMRSGVIWRENGWHGWFSDNEQFRRRVRGKWETVTEFASKYRGAATGPETPEFNYSALDAAMTAVAAEAMLGNERLTEFLEHGIWRAIGAEAPASWGVDKPRQPLVRAAFEQRCAIWHDSASSSLTKGAMLTDDRSYRRRGSTSLPKGIRRSMRYPGIIHPSIPAAHSTIVTFGGCFRVARISLRSDAPGSSFISIPTPTRSSSRSAIGVHGRTATACNAKLSKYMTHW